MSTDLDPGDRAALWVSGANAGVYVLGRVTGAVFEDVAGEGWPEQDGGRVMTFASLLLDEYLDVPVYRSELRGDPRFARARILTQPQAGSPFLTTDEEWAAIEDVVQARGSVWRPLQTQSGLG